MSGSYSQRPQRGSYGKRPYNSSYKPEIGRSSQNGYSGPKRAWNKGGSPQFKQNYSSVYSQYSNTGGKHFDSSLQLWMGDLDPNWDESIIMKIWTSFGESPRAVKIMKDKGQNPKLAKPNYCFVSFATQKDVASAMSKNGLQIPDSTKALKLNWASGSSGTNSASYGQTAAGVNKGIQKLEHSLFVGDLASDVTDAVLFEAFSDKYQGQVISAKMMTDPVTKVPKGFGFVRFKNQVTQQKAIAEMSGTMLKGRPIRVGLAGASGSSAKEPGYDTRDVQSITIDQSQPALSRFTDPNNSTLIVKGLASRFTVDELALHFICFGNIIYCKIDRDYNVGHIKFLSRASAEAALLTMSNTVINDCLLHITWGKSIQVESDYINFEPNRSKEYHKATSAPKYYGTIGDQNIRFDSIDQKCIRNLRVVEESEPLSINKANELYTASKLKRESLLKSLIL